MSNLNGGATFRSVSRGLSRRTLLRRGVTAGAGAAALALMACGGNSSSNSAAKTANGGATPAQPARAATNAAAATAAAAATPVPKRGGTLRTAQTGMITIHDPYRNASGAALPLYGAISARLFDLNPADATLQPSLIEAWEEIQPGLDYVLHVRKQAPWQNIPPANGRQFDADDVVYNIRYAAGLATPSNNADIARASWYFGINTVTATDSKTVHLTFSKPNSPILFAMGEQRQPVIPREAPDQISFNDFTKFPSIGPFIVRQFRDGESAIFDRNPNYWRTPYPYVDSAEIKYFGDAQSEKAALFSDNIDVYTATGAREADEISKTQGCVVSVAPFRSEAIIFINGKKFPDPRVWKALRTFFDYKTTMDGVYGDGFWAYTGPVNQVLPGAIKSADVMKLPGYNPATRDADIADAKKMLEAAGFPNGKGLTFTFTQAATSGATFDLSVRYQATVKQIVPDMAINLQPEPDLTAFNRVVLAQKNYDMFSYFLYEGPDARIAALNFQTGGSRNYGNYSNPQIDSMIDKAYAQSGQEAFATIGDIQKALLDGGVPQINCGTINDAMGSRSRVHGLQARMGPGSSGAINIGNTEREYLWLA